MIFELAQDFHDVLAAMPREHPKYRMLELLEEAIRRDIHFIAFRLTMLFSWLLSKGRAVGFLWREIDAVAVLRGCVVVLIGSGILFGCGPAETIDHVRQEFVSGRAVDAPSLAQQRVWGSQTDGSLDAATTREIQEHANAGRSKAGLADFATHPVLDDYAGRAAVAMAQAVLANPSNPSTPQEVKDLRLDDALPEAAQIALQLAVTGNRDDIVEQAAGWDFVANGAFTHLGMAVARVSLNPAQHAWVAVGLAAKLLPRLSPALINQGQREFHLKCHLCGHHYLGRLSVPPRQNSGALVTVCPNCNRTFNVFGVDEAGSYGRPHQFMRGFKPKEGKDALSLWLFVLANCRYVKDVTQYGRDEV